jgi:hypothetical protein
MDAQDIRNLQEAYLEVVENQQLDELTPATPRNIERLVTKREKDARKAEDRTGHKFTPEYKKYFRTLKLGKVRSKFDRPASRSVEPASTNEETDLYDIILSHLLDEGYAETPEAAEAIMVNMSEEWREDIVEFSQTELNSVSSSINQNTRNASIRKQQPGFQSSQSEPQRPTGVPIPGTARVFNTVKKVGQAVVGSALK